MKDKILTLKQEEEKVNLITEIMSISSQMEKLWVYHPNNPKSISIINEYSNLQNALTSLKLEFKEKFE